MDDKKLKLLDNNQKGILILNNLGNLCTKLGFKTVYSLSVLLF